MVRRQLQLCYKALLIEPGFCNGSVWFCRGELRGHQVVLWGSACGGVKPPLCQTAPLPLLLVRWLTGKRKIFSLRLEQAGMVRNNSRMPSNSSRNYEESKPSGRDLGRDPWRNEY